MHTPLYCNKTAAYPLDHIKEQTAQHINTHFDHRFGSAPDGLLDALHNSTQTALDRLPDHQDVKLRHDGITPKHYRHDTHLYRWLNQQHQKISPIYKHSVVNLDYKNASLWQNLI